VEPRKEYRRTVPTNKLKIYCMCFEKH